MTGRQIYRRVLTGALILVLGEVLGFREKENSVKEMQYVFSGGKILYNELQQNPLIVWEEAVTAAGGDAYTVSCSFCGVIPLKTCECTGNFPADACEGVRRKYRYLYRDKRCLILAQPEQQTDGRQCCLLSRRLKFVDGRGLYY